MGKCGLRRIVGDFRVQRLIEGLRIKQGMGLFPQPHSGIVDTRDQEERKQKKSRVSDDTAV